MIIARILATVAAVLAMSSAHAQSSVTRCDQTSAFPYDPSRTATGVTYDRLQPLIAIPVCDQALLELPNSGRLWFQYGRALERGGRLTEAIDAYGAARRLGHPGGANNLGELFRQGKGVPKDPRRAEALFREAAQADYPEGAFNLASIVMRKPAYDVQEVRHLLNVAAAIDYPNSRRLLASIGGAVSPTKPPQMAAAVPPSVAGTEPSAAPAPAAQQPATIVQIQMVGDQSASDKRALDILNAKIDLLTRVLDKQKSLASSADKDAADTAAQSIRAIEQTSAGAKAQYTRLASRLPGYSTPIRPTDADLYLTARKESELFPKVPYFIPGTPETGEFWVEPIVEDDGNLAFRFRFIDPTSVNDKTRAEIRLKMGEAERAQKAVAKLGPWSQTAKQARLRTYLEKRADCFPESDCPEGENRKAGQTSTEVMFVVKDDGSTMGRIQRNKGRYADKFDFSIESAMLLQSYMAYVIDLAKDDLNAGSKTKEELKQLFK